MTKKPLAPTGFWSYARRDDMWSEGKLQRLRHILLGELQMLLGRDEVELFQDSKNIPYGARWKERIQNAVNKSTFFIPIITPNFVQSRWCCIEVEMFLERQAQLFATYPDLPRESRIFPLRLIDTDGIEPAEPQVIDLLSELQRADFRHLRLKNFEDETVRLAIHELARSISAVLKFRVEPPLSAEERARLEAEAQAAREAEEARDREAEEERQREADEARRREAEEERKQAAAAAMQAAAHPRQSPVPRAIRSRARRPQWWRQGFQSVARPGPAMALLGILIAVTGLASGAFTGIGTDGPATATIGNKSVSSAPPVSPAEKLPVAPAAADPVKKLLSSHGFEGDCSNLMTISKPADMLIISFNGKQHRRRIKSVQGNRVTTDQGYYDVGENSVTAVEPGLGSYELSRCGT